MNEIEICGRKIGVAYKPFVIAEIGINHGGDINKACRMVDDACEAGCECVKFQCHVIEDEMIPNNVIPDNAEESIWDMMRRPGIVGTNHSGMRYCIALRYIRLLMKK